VSDSSHVDAGVRAGDTNRDDAGDGGGHDTVDGACPARGSTRNGAHR